MKQKGGKSAFKSSIMKPEHKAITGKKQTLAARYRVYRYQFKKCMSFRLDSVGSSLGRAVRPVQQENAN
jgi:hypothetical protein